MAEDPICDIFMTTSEAANILGVSKQIIQKWCDRAILRCNKTHGGHRRVSASSVYSLRREMAKPDLSSQYASLSGLPQWLAYKLNLGPHYAIQIPAVKLEMSTEGDRWRAYELRMYDAMDVLISSSRMSICEGDVATYPLIVKARMPGLMMVIQVDVTYHTLPTPKIITNPIMKHYLVKMSQT